MSRHNLELLARYAAVPEKRHTLQTLLLFAHRMTDAKLLTGANFVRNEIPVRFAHRIRDMQNLPYAVGRNEHIRLVYEAYWDAFNRLRKLPEVATLEDNQRFCDQLHDHLTEQLPIISLLNRGLQETQRYMEKRQRDAFFHSLLSSRTSRRLMALQHLHLSGRLHTKPGHIGIIHPAIDAAELIQRIAEATRQDCINKFHQCPEVKIESAGNGKFTGVPMYWEFIFSELFSNSMRSVLKRHARAETLPPVVAVISSTATHITFRISDLGGGISDQKLAQIWEYHHALDFFPDALQTLKADTGAASRQTAGLGAGLSISRVLTEYFSGTMKLETLQGHGTDVYITTLRHAEDQSEKIV